MVIFIAERALRYRLASPRLARQAGPDGVTVNNLAPGAIATPRNAQQFGDPEVRAAFEATVPNRRLGRPEDLVGAALLLCAPVAGSFITGTDLYVDGGFTGMRF